MMTNVPRLPLLCPLVSPLKQQTTTNDNDNDGDDRVKDTPDADASLTLLGNVRGLKAWLGQESPWRHDLRAKSVLTKLDELLVGLDKKEAKRFSQVREWAGGFVCEERGEVRVVVVKESVDGREGRGRG